MSIRDRRAKGVNFRTVLKATATLSKDPEFDPSDRKECAEKVLEYIVGKQLPQARADEPGIDWDSILAFIEKILPLILQIISLFD